MSDADERLAARLAGFAKAFETVNLIGKIGQLEQDARELREQLARMTPGTLEELFTAEDRALAQKHATGIAREA
jgi:hypothetical protein